MSDLLASRRMLQDEGLVTRPDAGLLTARHCEFHMPIIDLVSICNFDSGIYSAAPSGEVVPPVIRVCGCSPAQETKHPVGEHDRGSRGLLAAPQTPLDLESMFCYEISDYTTHQLLQLQPQRRVPWSSRGGHRLTAGSCIDMETCVGFYRSRRCVHFFGIAASRSGNSEYSTT